MNIAQLDRVIWAESSPYANRSQNDPDVRDRATASSNRGNCRELVAEFDSDEKVRNMIRMMSEPIMKDTRPLIFWGGFASRPP
jgi:hypothetical protein